MLAIITIVILLSKYVKWPFKTIQDVAEKSLGTARGSFICADENKKHSLPIRLGKRNS